MNLAVRYYSLLDGTGYGSAGFAYMEELLKLDIAVKWSPIVCLQSGMAPWELLSKSERPALDNKSERQSRFISTIDSEIEYDCIVLHTPPELYPKLVEKNKHNIGYTVWETSELPYHWRELVYHVDHLMVPCKNNVALFELPDGPEVSLMPHLPDQAIIRLTEKPENCFREKWGINNSTYVFYSINAWAPRKAIWETIHAYLLSFTENDDVCLVFKTDKTGDDFSRARSDKLMATRDMVNQIISAYPDPPEIVVVDDYLNNSQMRDLHQGCDCYYSLAHSEGWGLGAYEAATAGHPVIITGWGGQTDYLPSSLAYLVDYDLIPVDPDPKWGSYTRNQKWAQANIDHAILLLNHVFSHREEARRHGKELAAHIENCFSAKQIMDRFIQVLEFRDT